MLGSILQLLTAQVLPFFDLPCLHISNPTSQTYFSSIVYICNTNCIAMWHAQCSVVVIAGEADEV